MKVEYNKDMDNILQNYMKGHCSASKSTIKLARGELAIPYLCQVASDEVQQQVDVMPERPLRNEEDAKQ